MFKENVWRKDCRIGMWMGLHMQACIQHPLELCIQCFHDHVCRAVKTFSSSRLIMNSRRLWNLHQRHKFLRAEASKYILKFRLSEIAFPGVFKSYFPPQTPLFRQNIHAGLGTMPLKCSRHSTTLHISNISLI